MDRPEVRQVPEGSGEQGKMEETGYEIICGAPTTLAVKGLMKDEMRDQGERAAIIGTLRYFKLRFFISIGYPENAKFLPDKTCLPP